MTFIVLCFSFLLSSFSEASVSANETTVDGDNNFWGSGFSLATIDAQPAQDGGGRMTTYNYASLNMRGEGRTHWSLRLPFTYATAGFDDMNENNNQGQQIALADVLVDYSNNEMLLPGDIEVFSRYRIELPTSKYSIAQKKIAGLRVDFIASKNLIKGFELEYWPQFTWNIQTQTVYVNPDLDSLSHTKRYELNHRLSLWYRANQKLNVGFYVGGEDTWYNESKANDTSRAKDNRFAEHLLKVGPSIRYSFNRNFTFLFNVQNGVPLWGYKADRAGEFNDLGRFRPEHTQFVLLTFISL